MDAESVASSEYEQEEEENETSDTGSDSDNYDRSSEVPRWSFHFAIA